jgi:hypothetical protein
MDSGLNSSLLFCLGRRNYCPSPIPLCLSPLLSTCHRLDVSRAGNVCCIFHAACLLEDACRDSGTNLGHVFAHVPRFSRAKYQKLVLTPYGRVGSAVLVVLSRADRAATTTKATTAAVATTETMMISSLGSISNTTHKTIIVRLVLSSPTPWS